MSSSTGGYIVGAEVNLPGDLTLAQFIQQFLVGVTGMVNTTVRPKWQKNPGKEPATTEDNWCAFGITETPAQLDSYVEMGADSSTLQAQEELLIDLSFYGPEAYKNAKKLRDGIKIGQNRDVLRTGKIGFKEISSIRNFPEQKGGVWFQRSDVNLTLVRQADSVFAIVPVLSAGGTIEGLKDNDETETVQWNVSEP